MPTICVTAGCSNQKDEAKGISLQAMHTHHDFRQFGGGGEVPLFSTHPVCACHATFFLLDSSLLLNAFSVFSVEECINQKKRCFSCGSGPEFTLYETKTYQAESLS